MENFEQRRVTQTNHRRIAIIGAGPGGLCTAIKLQEAGYTNFVVFEKASGPGGTWFHNRYPGLTCDVMSHLYSYSFALNPHWSRTYASQAEILAYLESCVDRYGLRDRIQFDTAVERLVWDEKRSVWRVTTSDGRTAEFDAVVSALGLFNELNWPAIEGFAEFGGTAFHSARWLTDHDLSSEDVAVIGTAASAGQFIPEVAKRARSVTVYQRSAGWVVQKIDEPYSDEDRARFAGDPQAMREHRAKIYQDINVLLTWKDLPMVDFMRKSALENLQQVADPQLREKLTPRPDTPFGCKRPVVSSVYYPVYNLPHVRLVTEPIERFTHGGIRTVDGVERSAQTAIFATGYAAGRFVSAIEVEGRNGLSIRQAWADGAQAYLGITTSGFPNLFMLYGPNTNNGSIIFMIECQVDYIVRKLNSMQQERVAWIDVRRDAMDRYNDALQQDIATVEPWQASCSNYYRAPSGRVVTQWPHDMTVYRAWTSRDDQAAFDTGSG